MNHAVPRMRWLSVALMTGSLVVSSFECEGRPNIVIIYADDVGYGDLGCYGAEKIATPNLDRLARQGLRFTSAYASASTCTPSRYSLLTGEHAFRNRRAVILPGNAPLIIAPSKPTIASMLKGRGYATGLVGKWHLGLGSPDEPLDWNGSIAPGPRELGFDDSFHMAATGDRVPTVYIENGRVAGLDRDDPLGVSYQEPLGDEPTGLSHPHLLKTNADEQHAKTIIDGASRIGYMTGGASARWTDEELSDRFLQRAVGFIEENREGPFFLYYATHENHVPRIPHPRFRGASGVGVRGDAVVQLDWNVGVILQTLDRLGVTEETLVLFSSDNGPVLFDGYYDGAEEMNGAHRPAGPWRGGKYSVWEGGTRMPLIVSWPGTIDPGISGALVSQVDLLRSFAALVGAELPANTALDSQNVLDALLGKSDEARERLVQQGIGIQALREGDWKYIPPGQVSSRRGLSGFDKEPTGKQGALFYLPEDTGETRNLAHVYPRKARRMRERLQLLGSAKRSTSNSRDQFAGGAP